MDDYTSTLNGWILLPPALHILNQTAVEVTAWVINHIPHENMDKITYPYNLIAVNKWDVRLVIVNKGGCILIYVTRWYFSLSWDPAKDI